jgi:hypothetical protein
MTNPDLNVPETELGQGKLPYKSPTLTVFGSVRELTGGASTMGTADGGISMATMND